MTIAFALLTSALTAGLLAAPAPSAVEANAVRDLGSRRELFVDRHLIARLDGARLKLHEPRSEGAVLKLDQPWEGPHCTYTTVFKDGDRFRMYYRGTTPGPKREFTCYAESRDGIRWTRPALGLVEFEGSKQNNLLLADLLECTNFTPFLDARPGAPAEERYKALGGLGEGLTKRAVGLTAWVSADGIRWRKLRDEAVIAKKHVEFPHTHLFDSQNVAFWSASERCYVCYFRVSGRGRGPKDFVRLISRSTSADFVNWTPAVLMEQLHNDGSGPKPAPEEELYTNATTPYFRAPHLCLALPSRFIDDRDALTPEQKVQSGVNPAYRKAGYGFNDMPLMSTRDGHRYERTFLEAFIRPGLGLQNWTSRANYPACGIVPCADDPTRLAIYVNRHYGHSTSFIERLTLRLDGFVSVNAAYAGGELLTRPLKFAGHSLAINFATSAAGSIRIEIQDAAGKPIAGFAEADCLEIIGDEIERTVRWKKGADVSSLAGQTVRLRFAMKDADLFALQFIE